jgi:hypothetical protein
MAIARREVSVPIRWTHTITTPQFSAKLQVTHERIAKADPQLHSFIDQRYDKVREIASQRGWVLEEIPKPPRPRL